MVTDSTDNGIQSVPIFYLTTSAILIFRLAIQGINFLQLTRGKS
jgi:hypothetical protein